MATDFDGSKLFVDMWKVQAENATLRKQISEIKTGMDQYLFRGQPIAYWEELEAHAKEMDYVKYIEEILTLKKRVEEVEDDVHRLHKEKMTQWQRAEKAEADLQRLKEAVMKVKVSPTIDNFRELYKVPEELNSPPAAEPSPSKPECPLK